MNRKLPLSMKNQGIKNLLRPVFETLRTTPISTSVEFNSIK